MPDIRDVVIAAVARAYGMPSTMVTDETELGPRYEDIALEIVQAMRHAVETSPLHTVGEVIDDYTMTWIGEDPDELESC